MINALKKDCSAGELNTPSLTPPVKAEKQYRQNPMRMAINMIVTKRRIPPTTRKRKPLNIAVTMSNRTVRHPRTVFWVFGAEAYCPALRAPSMISSRRFSMLTGRPCMRRRSSGVHASGMMIHRMR